MRLLLADDHDLVRDALGTLLKKDDPEICVETAWDLDSALEKITGHMAFDVIILDLRMPGMNGLDGAERMVGVAGATPVVIMSGSARSSDVHAALQIGVKGFVPKTLAGGSLINAVRLVACGETYVPMQFMQGGEQAGETKGGLSMREREVLFQLRQGRSNKEIARNLDIAETTVKLHLRSISDKLEARNRTDIVIRAIDSGIA
jgi:DNA-binding NarL/FixJ family response regulator